MAKKKKTTKSKKAQSTSAKKKTSASKSQSAAKGAKAAKASKAGKTKAAGKSGSAPSKKKSAAAPASKKATAVKPASRGKKTAAPSTSKKVKGSKSAAQPAEKAAKGRKGKSKSAAVSESLRQALESSGGQLSSAEMTEELNFTPDYNDAGERICREVVCELVATTGDYCRLHYIRNWKRIKRKEMILKEGKLNRYIEELVAKYPDKYIEAIRTDLANDKDFAKVVSDLELDEAVDDFDMDSDSIDSLIDSIRRDIDEDTEF